MIALATLLIAASAGAVAAGEADTRRARARLNELRNRLGLAVYEPHGDLRSRLLHVLTKYKEKEPKAISRIFDMLYLLLNRAGVDDELVEEPISYWMPSFSLMLPPSGLRTRWDPMVPWIADEIAAYRLADSSRGPKDLLALLRSHEPGVLDARDLQLLSRPVLVRLRDWFEAISPNLAGYTFREALVASRNWHEDLERKEIAKGAEQATALVRWPDGATIQRLVTKKQLEQEGSVLRHCVGVGSYWQEVRDGRSVILSYRDPQGKPEVTIELRTAGGVHWAPDKPTLDPMKMSSSSRRVIQVQGEEDMPNWGLIGGARVLWYLTQVLKIEEHDVLNAMDDFAYLTHEQMDDLRRASGDAVAAAEEAVAEWNAAPVHSKLEDLDEVLMVDEMVDATSRFVDVLHELAETDVSDPGPGQEVHPIEIGSRQRAFEWKLMDWSSLAMRLLLVFEVTKAKRTKDGLKTDLVVSWEIREAGRSTYQGTSPWEVVELAMIVRARSGEPIPPQTLTLEGKMQVGSRGAIVLVNPSYVWLMHQHFVSVVEKEENR